MNLHNPWSCIRERPACTSFAVGISNRDWDPELILQQLQILDTEPAGALGSSNLDVPPASPGFEHVKCDTALGVDRARDRDVLFGRAYLWTRAVTIGIRCIRLTLFPSF